MAKSKLELLLEVEGANQAKRALDGVTGELDNMSRKQKDLSDTSRLAGRGLDMLGVAATGMVAAIGVREIAQAAVQLHDLGTASIRAREQLDNLTNGNAPEYINQVKAALRGTVTEMEAATISSNLYGLGLAKSAEEAAELARVSAILGGTFRNLGAAEAAQEFSLLLSNMSLLRLDSFGISSARVKQRMDELQASTANMTKEEAFYVATMEEATRKAEALESVLEDQRSQVELLKVEWQEAKTAVGEYLAEASVPLISSLNHEIKSYKHAQESARDLHREIARGATSYQDFAAQVGRVNQQLSNEQRQHLSLKQAYATRAYYAELLREIEEEAEAHERRLTDAWAARAAQGHDTARATEEVAEATEEEVSAADALAQAYVDGLISLEEYEAGKRELMTVSEQAAAKARNEAEALKELERAAKAAFDRQKSLAGIAEDLAGRYDYLGQTYTTIIGQDQQMVDLAADLTKERERLTEQIFREEFAWQVVGGDAEAYGKTMEDLTGKLAAVEAQLAAANERIGGQAQSYRITQLAADDLKSVGEGLLALWGESTNEIELQGAAYDQLRLKYGLVTQEQLNMERGLNAIVEAMDRNILSVNMISRIYDDWVTGAISDTEALNRRIADSEERYQGVLTKLDETGLAAGTAAEESEDAADRMNRSFDSASAAAGNINWQLAHIETKLTRMTGQPWDIRLRISGSVPDIPSIVGAGGVEMRAAGGPVTAGRAYVVGEKGPELFVPDRSGTIVPQNALASGGGQTIMPIYIGDRLLDEIVIDGWVRGVRRRGGDVSAITRGAIQA